MKPKIRAAFVDFGTCKACNTWIQFIERICDVTEDYDNPDYIFYSCFGVQHLKYTQAIKIFLCDENVYPDFNQCDYALSSLKIEYNRHVWFPPFYSTYLNREIPILPEVNKKLCKRKFCSFIYSQDKIGIGAKLRKDFCELLTLYKKVDCPGKILHNMDAPELAARNDLNNWNKSKLNFLSSYKFNIAFENSSAPGYITEKLMDCYLGNTVPIYFGSEGDISPFPKESMIYANDFSDLSSLVEKVKEVNEDDDKYIAMLEANPLRNQMSFNPEEKFKSFLLHIIQTNKENKVYEKDPLMVSDSTRLLRLGKASFGAIQIKLKLAIIIIKWLCDRFILRNKSTSHGIHYWQLKYALNDLTELKKIKDYMVQRQKSGTASEK